MQYMYVQAGCVGVPMMSGGQESGGNGVCAVVR